MRSRLRWTALLLVASASAAGAGNPLAPLAPEAITFRKPQLEARAVLVAAASLAGSERERADRDLAALGADPGSSYLDRTTGQWATLLLAEPMIPGAGNALSWEIAGLAEPPDDAAAIGEAAWARLSSWIAQHAEALRIDSAELGAPAILAHDGGALVQIFVPRRIDGIAVRGAALVATISHGNLVLLGTDRWGEAPRATVARYGAAEARERVARALAAAALAGGLEAPVLALLPFLETDGGLGARLAWEVRARLPESGGIWLAEVDAVTNELLSFVEETQHLAGPSIVGGTYPLTNDGTAVVGVLQSSPMPFIEIDLADDLGTLTSDSGGNVDECVDSSFGVLLDGPYVRVHDACGAIQEIRSSSGLDLGGAAGTTPHDCAVPPGHSAGNTAAGRTAFYEANRMAELARGLLPGNSWLGQRLSIDTNLEDECRAASDVDGIHLYLGGADCRNTGEIASIIDHEWAHLLDVHGVNPSASNPADGLADALAALRLNDSCIGRGLRLDASNCDGFGDACTQCSGVRDNDFARHQSMTPHGITWVNATCTVGSVNGPCGKNADCEATVVAEAIWDLWNRDLRQAPFNFTVDQARETVARLAYLGSQLLTNWYQCSAGGGDGCNALGGYLNFLAVDDDDGNLSDGTPHMTAIFAAFNRHQIACPVPVSFNAGCAGGPTAAPTVAAQPLSRGASLTWNAVANASAYRVYRNDGAAGCALGQVLVGETATTSWSDSDLAAGTTYSYTVLPVGTTSSCFGRTSVCASVLPTAPPDGCSWLFVDGFESSGTTRWSAQLP